ncbi:MAG: ion transporter [Acidobacteria bacterium]|nr:ion transporter [Acidobacteriota bacterium]
METNPQTIRRPEEDGAYLLFMLALSLISLGTLALTTVARLDEPTMSLLVKADTLVCLFFFVDFLRSFYKAENRLTYFVTWGWLDLISSIPMVDALRAGRLARVLRILRVFRGLRATKIISTFILERRTRGAVLAATLIAGLLVFVSSIAILQVETLPESNIKTPEDALWWSFVTITTVGYGDKFPSSTEGRLIASGLMLAGVGLFGALSGFIAAWFLRPEQQHQESEIEELIVEIRALRTEVAALREGSPSREAERPGAG